MTVDSALTANAGIAGEDATPRAPSFAISPPRSTAFARLLGSRMVTMLAALAVECLLAMAAVSTNAPGWVLLGVHLAVVAGLAWRVRAVARSGRNANGIMLVSLLTAVAGPAGAAVGLLGALCLPRVTSTTRLLSDWYERIALAGHRDPVTAMCDSIAIGRGLDLSAPAPAPFAAIIRHGTLLDRQTALGLIARDYHPAYIGALKLALRSPEPVIRVQAAAVAARLRDSIAASLQDGLRRAPLTRDVVEGLVLIGEIEAAVDSGLVDETLAARGRTVVSRLKAQVVSSLSTMDAAFLAARLARHRRPDDPIMGTQLRLRLDTQLAELKMWPHLRACRRSAHLAGRGLWVMRRRRQRPGAEKRIAIRRAAAGQRDE